MDAPFFREISIIEKFYAKLISSLGFHFPDFTFDSDGRTGKRGTGTGGDWLCQPVCESFQESGVLIGAIDIPKGTFSLMEGAISIQIQSIEMTVWYWLEAHF